MNINRIITQIRNFDDLKKLLLGQQMNYDLEIIQQAYAFADKTHLGQTRISGELAITHCLIVAALVAHLGLDTVSICSALLHDTVDKGGKSIDEIDKLFGTEIAFIIQGLSGVKDLSKTAKNTIYQRVEKLLNMLIAGADDIRIIVIWIAEKVHNILTLNNLPEEVRINSAQKAQNIYAPLAEYAGLSAFQKILEDESFKILKPDLYSQIEQKRELFLKNSVDVTNEFEIEINNLLKEFNITNYKVSSRIKSIYSIYRKLKNKYNFKIEEGNLDESFQRLKDIFAARILVEDVKTCYAILGLLQSNFEVIQDEFSDYIAQPKDNGYRSIHTIIIYNGLFLEIQIRTFEMHEYNEFGAASHIAYKLQDTKQTFTWTKDLLNWKNSEEDKKEKYKLKIFKESIFCFTPKGMIISLPQGATPLDFAFRVHTNIGERYVGAKVNGKMEKMSHELSNGDVVEIITGKQSNVSLDWLRFCRSHTTKAKIKKIFANKQKEEFLK